MILELIGTQGFWVAAGLLFVARRQITLENRVNRLILRLGVDGALEPESVEILISGAKSTIEDLIEGIM